MIPKAPLIYKHDDDGVKDMVERLSLMMSPSKRDNVKLLSKNELTEFYRERFSKDKSIFHKERSSNSMNFQSKKESLMHFGMKQPEVNPESIQA